VEVVDVLIVLRCAGCGALFGVCEADYRGQITAVKRALVSPGVRRRRGIRGVPKAVSITRRTTMFTERGNEP
jgi:hypothetical protein